MAVKGVTAYSDRGGIALRDIDLDVRAGELVGVAGVAGNGQRELAEVVLGLRSVMRGHVELGGKPIHAGRPADALAAGVVGIPEDPLSHAVVPGLDVAGHLALHDLDSFARRLGLDWAKVKARLGELDRHTQLRTASPERVVSTLSGGNIQRVMLTRALGAPCRAVVAAYPTRGLDIVTTRRTQELLLERRAEGAGVLLVSEDLDELMELSDRIVVLHAGEIAGTVEPSKVDRYVIGKLMLEGKPA